MQIISAEQIRSVLDWDGVLNALHNGHLGLRPIGDSYFIGDARFGLFSRGVILPGKGAGFKMASIYPANSTASPPLPTEQAAFLVLDERTKGIVAMLDGPEITRWKTAADSALAARKLSRENSEVLLVLGAGPVARSLTDAYLHIRPSIREVLLWNRTPSKLDAMRAELVAKNIQVRIVEDLDAAVARADIITAATSAATPTIRGKFVRPGTHVDLVGGYRPDMQEADCEVLRGARIFVDDRENAAHSGDIQIPLQAQVIQADQIEGDLFDLCQMPAFHRSAEDRTVYKNAGGAHLDLIVSQLVVERLNALAK
ncbi:ornithine cyclodeaminase family protein [Pseudogulbenkiania ferrooxidans]|uniref:Ornithine cyclodeaminase/mu-crystallin n=1 Tax=Pseudogulbenkiania ferrooxidans 2002 TaxID=279714 RepID=B9Z050_9NEIS|nr:ornithine cyclodeaminase [Pseudogulbenkiania ferrooxidans]EEG09933.1 ornithine cyclodeaminase/mu-crystallin [Pseudogulbenkiania ferrooxidans 2002]